jgi:hypothetical protein
MGSISKLRYLFATKGKGETKVKNKNLKEFDEKYFERLKKVKKVFER